MTTPAAANERQFPVFDRGEFRDDLLTNYRLGLVGRINPDTGQVFTSEEIATATAPGSLHYNEADGLDLVLLAAQSRALWLCDQVLPDRAATSSLQNLWGPLWAPGGYLQASGGSGTVTTKAVPGTVWKGSTTVPDPGAVYGTDPALLRYQVLFDVVTPGSGIATLTVVGIDTGPATNLDVGTALAWANAPPSATGPGAVAAKFTGGLPAENDAAFAKRIISQIRHRQAAGNAPQIAGWAQTSGNTDAVEQGFVYACALHAGTVVVAVTQKRGAVQGPTGRIPSPGTLAQATAYLVPPGSPVVPGIAFFVVTGVAGTATDLVISLSMPVGSPAGFDDLQPWPGQAGGVAAQITQVTNQTHVQITTTLALPAGNPAPPQVMVWNDAISRFEQLQLLSVALNAGNIYDVVLAQAPAKTLLVGDFVSPYSQRLGLIAQTIEGYFDDLGPGEVVDLSSDPRAHRAFRFPQPSETYPQIAGTAVITYLEDALGSSLALGLLQSITVTQPPLPADPAVGPTMLVAGKVGIYAL